MDEVTIVNDEAMLRLNWSIRPTPQGQKSGGAEGTHSTDLVETKLTRCHNPTQGNAVEHATSIKPQLDLTRKHASSYRSPEPYPPSLPPPHPPVWTTIATPPTRSSPPPPDHAELALASDAPRSVPTPARRTCWRKIALLSSSQPHPPPPPNRHIEGETDRGPQPQSAQATADRPPTPLPSPPLPPCQSDAPFCQPESDPASNRSGRRVPTRPVGRKRYAGAWLRLGTTPSMSTIEHRPCIIGSILTKLQAPLRRDYPLAGTGTDE